MRYVVQMQYSTVFSPCGEITKKVLIVFLDHLFDVSFSTLLIRISLLNSMLCTRVLHCVCVYVAASVLAPYTTLVNCQPKLKIINIITRVPSRSHCFPAISAKSGEKPSEEQVKYQLSFAISRNFYFENKLGTLLLLYY